MGILGNTIWHTPIGEANKRETILVYHNNWLRPENSVMGGNVRHAIDHDIWSTHPVGDMLISKEYYTNDAFTKQDRRQWMATRWLYIERDSKGKIIDIMSATPQIDDLDPFHYYLYLVIPKEIESEINLGKVFSRTPKSNGESPITIQPNILGMSLAKFESALDSDSWPKIDAQMEITDSRR